VKGTPPGHGTFQAGDDIAAATGRSQFQVKLPSLPRFFRGTETGQGPLRLAHLGGLLLSAVGEEALLGDGRLALTFENLSSGQIYQSHVPLEGSSMSEIFENYLKRSEQRTSFLRLFADAGSVCGLLLEKLPGADTKDADGWNRVGHLARTLTLAESVNAQPYDLLVKLFPEELLRVFKLDAVTYHCPFNVENVERVLRGLGRAECESILAEQGKIVVKNEMCNHEYRFNREDVEALFA
jgi:molecular chaperone Hsp33